MKTLCKVCGDGEEVSVFEGNSKFRTCIGGCGSDYATAEDVNYNSGKIYCGY